MKVNIKLSSEKRIGMFTLLDGWIVALTTIKHSTIKQYNINKKKRRRDEEG
jgi:hypothetical protein